MKILSELLCIETVIRSKDKMLSSLREELVTDESVLENIKALQKEINADIDALTDKKREAMHFIDNSELTPTEKEVIYNRYLSMMKWPDIAKEMHYSEASIHRIHNIALEHLNK